MGRMQALVKWGVAIGCGAALLGVTPAASAAPVALDGPQSGSKPLIRYDLMGGATFVAWSDAQAPDGGIELCVLPNDETRCAGGGPVLLSVSNAENPEISAENAVSLQGLTVAPDGDVTVTGMAVEGGSVTWESGPSGSAFRSAGQGLQDNGAFISPVDPVYSFDNVVALGNSDVGILDDAADFWSDSAITGPESPPIAAPNSNPANGGLYPGQPVDIDGPAVAAEPTPDVPGSETVVAVGDQFVGPTTTLPGCVNSTGTGFAVDEGSIDGQSNATGTLNQGIPAYQRLACSAENPTLSVGSVSTAPIGVLENEGNAISGAGHTYSIDYRPLVTGQDLGPGETTLPNDSFGTPVKLAQLTRTASDLSLANDGADGVYAYWYEGGVDSFDVDYSPNGGDQWGGPVRISDPTFRQYEDNPSLTAVGDGAFDIAFDANPGTGTETYVERFDYHQLATPVPATVPRTATATRSAVTFRVSCVLPCSVSVILTVPAATAAAGRARPGVGTATPVRVLTGKINSFTAGTHSFALDWNTTGRHLIAEHRTLRTTLSLSTETARGTYRSSHALTVTRKR